MKVIAAYLLAVLGGKPSPSAEDFREILDTVGAESKDERIELLLSQVKGKDITELIAPGKDKLAASAPFGRGRVVALAVAAPPGNAAVATKDEEPKGKEPQDDTED